ncbi:MAG: PEP-CTERM sorting domain-containing protein [Alphaproteobacteria bacterium]|nr:PEP-CTERM sorting domain-containing protein [Alphaproteobacteria bacterium]
MLASLLALSATNAQATAIRLNTGFNNNTIAAIDDGSTGLINFGFTINFFGNNRTGGYVNTNGNVTLDAGLGDFTPFPLSTTSQEILAPFFADVDTTTGAPVKYGADTVGGRNAFGANWIDVCFFPRDCRVTNSFQLVIIDRSDITSGDFDFEFNFDDINWETGNLSGGRGGLGGNSARVGWSNGSGSTFELTGSAVSGAFLNGGPSSLISNELNSNLSVDGTTMGRYFFQVRNGNVVQPPSAVPAPGALTLFGFGLIGLGLARRKRKK